MPESFPVPIRDESIKLGQFLKLANLAETGGEAKEFIAGGDVTVNGETVSKRGHALHDGDTVEVFGRTAIVVAQGKDNDDDDYFDEKTANDNFDPEKWRNL